MLIIQKLADGTQSFLKFFREWKNISSANRSAGQGESM